MKEHNSAAKKIQKALWSDLFDKLDDLHEIVRERAIENNKKKKKVVVYIERDPH